MKWDAARKLSTRLIHAGAGHVPMPHDVNWLTFELCGLLSDDAQAGIAAVNDHPAVIARDGNSLLVITCRQQDEGVTIETRQLPVGDSRQIRLISTIGPGEVPESRRRLWSLGDPPVEIHTSERLYGTFPSDRGTVEAEMLLRAYARDAGWPIPDEDPGREML